MSPVHDFATSSHRAHSHSEHNMSPLYMDVHESNHETMELPQSDQHTPLLQQVQDPPHVTLHEDHVSPQHHFCPDDFDTVLDD